jgi:outer membrane protein
LKISVPALSCLVLAAATMATAQTPVPNKVGVIQIQGAIISTRDGQKAVADLQTRMDPRKRDLEKKQGEIRDLQEKLQKGGNAMADDAKQDLARTIDQKTKNYNRDMQDAQAEFEEEQRKLLGDLGQKMMKIIDNYAQSNGFSVILDVSNPNTPVLYASNTVDITKDIIALYDKTAPAATPASSAPKATPPAAAPKPAAPAAAAPAPKKP